MIVVHENTELFIKNHPFSRDLDVERTRLLGGCAESAELQPGQYLWRQGDRPDVLFLVESGELSLEILVPNQGPLRVESIQAGEWTGSWLTPLEPCEFDVRAVTAVDGVLLRGEGLRSIFAQDAWLGYELLQRWTLTTARRLSRARRRLIEPHGGPI